jgi:hypothetical protein
MITSCSLLISRYSPDRIQNLNRLRRFMVRNQTILEQVLAELADISPKKIDHPPIRFFFRYAERIASSTGSTLWQAGADPALCRLQGKEYDNFNPM